MAAEDRITPIEDLRSGMKNVHCIFIVIDRGTQQKTKDGSTVRKCRVADRTGSIMFSVWNKEGEAISTGDIIRLTKGYSSLWKGSLVLYCGKYGLVERLGDFTMVFSETPDMSIVQEEGSVQQSPHSVSETSSDPHQSTLVSKNRQSLDNSAAVSSSSSSSPHSNGHIINAGGSGKLQPPTNHRRPISSSHDTHMTQHHNNSAPPVHRHHPYSRQNPREHGWQ